MKIGLVKPDFRVTGGFELVVERIARDLRARGHTVDLVLLDATQDQTGALPVMVPRALFDLFPQFFVHANLALRFEQLDVSAYDAVLTTQPPSYAVRHPRQVSLFYHHLKYCYDLMPAMLKARHVDTRLLLKGAEIVREIDAAYLSPELPILAGSKRVKERLARFNGLEDNVSVIYAGIADEYLAYDGPIAYQHPICVGRHEFPKRPELFIHALKHLPAMRGRLVGTGGMSPQLAHIDAYLTHLHARGGCGVEDAALWQDLIFTIDPAVAARAASDNRKARIASNIDFVGRVSHPQLVEEYASALCAVCPAYEEDYGLTCLEAMAFGKPVIACDDGGGYAELITHGVDGFIVPPTGAAIAEAIARLADLDVAREMGRRAREKSRQFPWATAIDRIESTLASVCA